MAYLRAAGNGVAAEVIRERQHLHKHNIKGDSNVVVRPAGERPALYLGAKIEMAGRQAATPLDLGSRR
jgi:hypothetical protein